MISKELLSEVLGTYVVDMYIEDTVSFGMQIAIKDTDEDYTYINIHELAHKCKVWAFTRGYAVSIEQIDEETHYGDKWYLGLNKNYWFHGETEPNLIFKACQWILDNKDIK